ncbi:MAG: DeoR family transcriptional regulator [Candidatus Pacebacteria bacterium]|nr:DeoR family transcriptional regulator [Candidatus Paceibacterota bacterium]
MEKQKIVQLTNKIYRLTVLFPKKEPLRYKIRESANDILHDIINLDNFKNNHFIIKEESNQVLIRKKEELFFLLESDIEIILAYFSIAKWQNWVSYFDILDIEEEYSGIKEEALTARKSLLDELESSFDKTAPLDLNNKDFIEREKEVEGNSLDKRKGKIIEILKQRQRIQVWEVSKVFPQVSKRTLRRDFVDLLKKGLIERVGEKNETFYKLKLDRT